MQKIITNPAQNVARKPLFRGRGLSVHAAGYALRAPLSAQTGGYASPSYVSSAPKTSRFTPHTPDSVDDHRRTCRNPSPHNAIRGIVHKNFKRMIFYIKSMHAIFAIIRFKRKEITATMRKRPRRNLTSRARQSILLHHISRRLVHLTDILIVLPWRKSIQFRKPSPRQFRRLLVF